MASNTFFDWAVSLTRFVKRDVARSDEINDALDSISNGFTAAEALTNAAIKLPAGETSAAIGNVAARKGKVLTFNATTGAAEATTATTDVATIAANIADVNTVAGISANVTTVAGISANVTTVAGISGNVTTVAGINAAVTAVAAIDAAVTAVNANAANVNTVATNIANVNTVGGISANVTTVAGISANTTTVAGISGDVTTVAGVAASVSTVAGISANVTTVATNDANVTTVAGISAAVSTVATNATAVSTVSTNIADVNTAATNIAAIIAAPTEASNAANSASAAAASYDAFDDRYLGSKAADPTLDNDGAALLTGALYWNSVASEMRVYSGSAWAAAYLPASGYAVLAANTFTAAQIYGDQQNSRAMLIDCGYVFLDKGNSGTDLQTFDYTAGSVQKVTATGNHTFAFSNWPPTGNEGYMRVDFANYGAYTITPPTVTWTNPDGTETTTLSAHFTALAAAGGRAGFTASGLTKAIFWCKDAVTVYGRFI